MQKRDARSIPRSSPTRPRPGQDRDPATEVLRTLREYSPVAHVTAGDPATILIHDYQDRWVPVQQSPRLSQQLTGAGVPARLVVREGAGHAYRGWEADAALIADWFDTHLERGR